MLLQARHSAHPCASARQSGEKCGLAILVKSLLQGSFSLMVFAWAQILMDLQPLFAIFTDKVQLHGFSSTIIGASLIAITAALTGKRLSEIVMI